MKRTWRLGDVSAQQEGNSPGTEGALKIRKSEFNGGLLLAVKRTKSGILWVDCLMDQ
jgi:hypothetical protein